MTPLESEKQAIAQLHQLWQEGKGESPEADIIREDLSGNWKLLTDAEREQVRDYCERLNDEAGEGA